MSLIFVNFSPREFNLFFQTSEAIGVGDTLNRKSEERTIIVFENIKPQFKLFIKVRSALMVMITEKTHKSVDDGDIIHIYDHTISHMCFIHLYYTVWIWLTMRTKALLKIHLFTTMYRIFIIDIVRVVFYFFKKKSEACQSVAKLFEYRCGSFDHRSVSRKILKFDWGWKFGDIASR